MSPYLPSLVGLGEIQVKLGAFSGNASVKYWLKKLGYEASDEQIKEILDIVRQEGRIRGTLLEMKDFKGIVEKVL
jgi:2-isopropylmalate synthase